MTTQRISIFLSTKSSVAIHDYGNMPWHHQIARRIGLFDMFGLFAKTLALQNFITAALGRVPTRGGPKIITKSFWSEMVHLHEFF